MTHSHSAQPAPAPSPARSAARSAAPSSVPVEDGVALVLDVRHIDVDAVACDLIDTDAVTASDDTGYPDHYLVHPENMSYLVGTVLALSADAPRLPSRPVFDELLLALASFKDQVEEFVADAERGAEEWGTCSGEWARLERLRSLLDTAPSTHAVHALTTPALST